MFKKVMTLWIPFVLIIIAIAFIKSTKGGAINWDYIIELSLFGLVGIFIGASLGNFRKKK